MPEIECFHCQHRWLLGDTTTNRCPQCGWVIEIYYDQGDANRAADIYNTSLPPSMAPSGVCPLHDINGYAVAFPDQGRLAEIADQLVNHRPR